MDKLQKIYETSLLQKLGSNHTWPKDLRYGNHNIGSLHIPNLYLEQFLYQLDIILQMLHNNEQKTNVQYHKHIPLAILWRTRSSPITKKVHIYR